MLSSNLKEWSDGTVSKGVQDGVTSLVHVGIEVFSVDLKIRIMISYFFLVIFLVRNFYLVVVGILLGEFLADEIFVLVVEFVWSDNNGVDCVVNRVNSLKFMLVSYSQVRGHRIFDHDSPCRRILEWPFRNRKHFRDACNPILHQRRRS